MWWREWGRIPLMMTIHVEYKGKGEHIRDAGHNATHEQAHIPLGDSY